MSVFRPCCLDLKTDTSTPPELVLGCRARKLEWLSSAYHLVIPKMPLLQPPPTRWSLRFAADAIAVHWGGGWVVEVTYAE